MQKLKNVVIIPARGGSKRIPRKNIKNFFGQPIIGYSIKSAIQSGLFDEVMVSTDDNEIANISLELGAKVPFMRSVENSDDFSTLSDVLMEVVLKYEENGIRIDNVCCILPTAPFITAERLKDAFDVFTNGNFDSLYPVVEFSYPIQRSLIKSDESRISMAQPQYLKTRSQDLQKHYFDSGQFYWIKASSLLETKSLMTNNTGMIELSPLEVQDIDTQSDWDVAEVKYKLIHG